ncbi:hypothetical protein GCM10010172_00800 [Paractinoplanes ferrugineus]|uniref:Lipoprotein n=1 Tax=Paractinoplanes ferrugineus TaxID=113564 RepID=A0A919J5X3_9ACTN|nr:hypothetical protein [Actinoplanes ferrugineus]GIE13927.1 hypothetical protein Afe05nite_57670 [Actinoplanes ferrugineus]
MSARRLLLLPAATVLFALAACGATAEPSTGSSGFASVPAAPVGGGAEATTAVPANPAADTKSADCPSAATLQKLVELPKGVALGSIKCVQGWAGADPQGANVGDGVYLFHYKAGTGWKYYGDGSGYDCKDLGITKPAPFCVSESVTAKTKPAASSPKCPSGKSLEALVELPKGATFGNVQCVKDWAGADPQGAGDGVYLFHYKAGTGWKYYGEGSGYDCKDLGLTVSAPFCIS